ncbi:TetR/AcrR family transcriptional regulator [soil metagenome]
MSEKATAKENSPPSTSEKILEAAKALFAERGFKGTTTSAIAKRAGVNEALIYRHFPAKGDLYTAILRERLESEAMIKLLKVAECQALTVEGALRLVAERFCQAQDPVFLRLYYHSALEGHALASEFYDQYQRRFVAMVDQLILRGIEEGLFRKVDSLLAAQAFIGMFRAYFVGTELFPDPTLKRPREEVVAMFCDVFIQGIRRLEKKY